MAKYRIPSQKSIDLYNRLVAQQNKTRKTLRRIHKQAEETLGAGRLPALVIPKSAHKIKRNYFEGLSSEQLHARLRAWYSRLHEMQTLFAKGAKSYLAKTIKEGYLDLWLDQIEAHTGERPEGFNGHIFTREQIEKSEFGDFMQTYNRLFRLSPLSFLAMLYTGRMIAFKYIYREMEKRRGRNFEGSWLEEQNQLLSLKGITAEIWIDKSGNLVKPKEQVSEVRKATEEKSNYNPTGKGHGKKPKLKDLDEEGNVRE